MNHQISLPVEVRPEEVMRKQSLGSAFLFISHNPAILQKICDRILVMYAGEIVEQGPAARLLSQPLHPYTQALIDAVPARRTPTLAAA